MRIARPLEVEEPIGRVDGDATRLLGGDEHDWHEGTPVEHEQVAGGVRLDLRDGADLRAVGEHHRGADELVHPEGAVVLRSEEPTSELQSLMRISYAVFCLKN